MAVEPRLRGADAVLAAHAAEVDEQQLTRAGQAVFVSLNGALQMRLARGIALREQMPAEAEIRARMLGAEREELAEQRGRGFIPTARRRSSSFMATCEQCE